MGPRENQMMQLAKNVRNEREAASYGRPPQSYNMNAAYSINNDMENLDQSPDHYDPALVGEHGDYDPYAGMNPIQREEAERKRKREINEILGMIDEMRMSEDSDSDSDASRSRKQKSSNKKQKPAPNQNVRGIKKKRQQSESEEYSESDSEDESYDSDDSNPRRKKKNKGCVIF